MEFIIECLLNLVVYGGLFGIFAFMADYFSKEEEMPRDMSIYFMEDKNNGI